jgi:hypothetical protein
MSKGARPACGTNLAAKTGTKKAWAGQYGGAHPPASERSRAPAPRATYGSEMDKTAWSRVARMSGRPHLAEIYYSRGLQLCICRKSLLSPRLGYKCFSVFLFTFSPQGRLTCSISNVSLNKRAAFLETRSFHVFKSLLRHGGVLHMEYDAAYYIGVTIHCILLCFKTRTRPFACLSVYL